MGITKDEYYEAISRGYYFDTDKKICISCLNNNDFIDIFNEYSIETECTYCGEIKETVQLGFITERIMDAIAPYYYNFDKIGMSYDNANEYLNDPIYTFREILDELSLDINDEIKKDIIDAVTIESFFDDSSLYESESKRLISSYDKYSYLTKHSKRYFFNDNEEYEITDIKPVELMESIFEKMIDFDRISKIPEKTIIFRARIDKKKYNKFEDLVAPPPEKAFYSNRFNPAGISMFYGSLNDKTCIRELNIKKNLFRNISLGCFETKKDIYLFDLSKEIDLPGFFSEQTYLREFIIFYNELIEKLTIPVIKDGREHIEYVPTQIFVEFLKMKAKQMEKDISGILYKSAVDDENNNILLFENKKNKEILNLSKVKHMKCFLKLTI